MRRISLLLLVFWLSIPFAFAGATAEKDAVSAPVKGMSGVYVFQVTEVKDAATQTAEAEQVRAQAVQESMTAQHALQAVQQMAEIEDLRGKYF